MTASGLLSPSSASYTISYACNVLGQPSTLGACRERPPDNIVDGNHTRGEGHIFKECVVMPRYVLHSLY